MLWVDGPGNCVEIAVRRITLSFAVAILAVLPLAPRAHALGLDALAGGGSLTSGNNVLTFDDFEVITTGSVRSDLSLYDVSALLDGIAITGPISAADGSAGDLFVQFSVKSTQPIVGAALNFNGAASGAGSSASVTETFAEIDDGQLFVSATGAGGLDLSDSMTIAGLTSLRVSKDILVDSGTGKGGSDDDDDDDQGENEGLHKGWLIGKGHAKNHGVPDLKHQLGDDDGDDEGEGHGAHGNLAVISRVEQHFTTTAPEPAALLLLGSALAGLAFARKRLA